MSKKETIWRYLLHTAMTQKKYTFTQKDIAARLNVSTSTVFSALRLPRRLGAIEVTGRNFRLRDAEKLLLLWASCRNLTRDIIYTTVVDEPVQQIEGAMPPDIIFGAFSAYRLKYHEAPADYSKVYVYTENLPAIQARFPKKKGAPNLFVLKPDKDLAAFGDTTPPVQTFVDLWNIPDWYAKDFLSSLKQKIL